jgi:hypothetical protein
VWHEDQHLPPSNSAVNNVTSYTSIPNMLSKNGAKLNAKTTLHLRFEVLSVVLLKIHVILDVTQHSWVSSLDVLKAL